MWEKCYLNVVPAVNLSNYSAAVHSGMLISREMRTEELIYFSLCQQSGQSKSRIKR